jgi:hypothetical protein
MLKNIVFLGVLLALAVPAVANRHQVVSERSTSQSQQNTQQPSPAAAPITNNQTTAYYQQDAKDKPVGWHKFVTWPEGFTAWLLMLTLIAIIWQAKATADAARATKNSVQLIIDKERARLRIELKPLIYEARSGPGRRLRYSQTDIDQMNSDDVRKLLETNDRPFADACEYHHGTPLDSIGPEIEYRVIQDGETSAFIESAVGDVQIRDTDLVKFEEAFTFLHLPKVIKSGAEPLQRYALISPILSGDVLEDVKTKRKFIHFYGVIRYKDVFRQTRETGFYFTWHITNHPARPLHHPDNWVKRKCPGYDQET